MAFTCRPTPSQEKIIAGLCEYFQTSVKTKAVLSAAENHLGIIEERNYYKQLSERKIAELDQLKRAIANKFEADKQLLNIINV